MVSKSQHISTKLPDQCITLERPPRNLAMKTNEIKYSESTDSLNIQTARKAVNQQSLNFSNECVFIPTDLKMNSIIEGKNSSESLSGTELQTGLLRSNSTCEPQVSKVPSSFSCPVCFDTYSIDYIYRLPCNHSCCVSCFCLHIMHNLKESARRFTTCVSCDSNILLADVVCAFKKAISLNITDSFHIYGFSLTEEYIGWASMKYEERMVFKTLNEIPGFCWCPGPDCNYGVLCDLCEECPKVTCPMPACGTSFCSRCRSKWHVGITCKENQQKYFKENFGTLNLIAKSKENAELTEQIKLCPSCMSLISKKDDGSCNHMTCMVCGISFCWLCLQEVNDMHFIQASGCTYWGTKQWSTFRRISTQISIIFGAPIIVVAGTVVAVPVLFIGLPCYTFFKTKQFCTKKRWNPLRRRLITAASTLTSIVISPLVISGGVLVGVPASLAYIYISIFKEIKTRIKVNKKIKEPPLSYYNT